MAIFAADEFGDAISRCWLAARGTGDWKEVTRLAVRVNIPAIESAADMPPAAGWLVASGSIDLLKTDDEGYIIAGFDQRPIPVRHYGMIKLIWSNLV